MILMREIIQQQVQQSEAFHFTLTFVGSLLADGAEELLGRLLRLG